MDSLLVTLADPTRRRLLDALRGGERTVGELVQAVGTTQPAASKHLRVLREAGLVRVRADGQRRIYAVDPAPLAELDEWLGCYRALGRSALDRISQHLAEGC